MGASNITEALRTGSSNSWINLTCWKILPQVLFGFLKINFTVDWDDVELSGFWMHANKIDAKIVCNQQV